MQLIMATASLIIIYPPFKQLFSCRRICSVRTHKNLLHLTRRWIQAFYQSALGKGIK